MGGTLIRTGGPNDVRGGCTRPEQLTPPRADRRPGKGAAATRARSCPVAGMTYRRRSQSQADVWDPKGACSAGSSSDRSSAASSTSTNQRLEAADQRPWPSYGTRLAAASPAHRRRRSATRPSVTCPCGTASSLPTTSARPPSGRTTSTSSRSPGDSSTCEPSVTRRLCSSRRPASMSPRRGASLNPGRPPQNRNDQTPSGLRAYPYRHRSVGHYTSHQNEVSARSGMPRTVPAGPGMPAPADRR